MVGVGGLLQQRATEQLMEQSSIRTEAREALPAKQIIHATVGTQPMEEEDKMASLALAAAAGAAAGAAAPSDPGSLGWGGGIASAAMEAAEAGVDLELAVALAVALGVMPSR
jgi:hypothetical protein